MVGEAVKEKQLYDAASQGDVSRLRQALDGGDPYLVNNVSFAGSRNLLHIAATHGQPGIMEEVLKLNPELARDSDSHDSSPLHIAAARGHVESARILLSAAPDMCWSRDSQGMNPVHVAAMNGSVGVLEEMLQLNPLPAMERLRRRQTVMHLCVKRGQLRALEVLTERIGEVVCEEDEDGETILHLAVRCKQVEIIKYLVENTEIDKNSKNSKNKRAVDILEESPPHTTRSEIRALITRDERISLLNIPVGPSRDTNNAVMVVAVLIATMAFQAAVSPPGGVRQNEDDGGGAGDAVMASTHPLVHRLFLAANTSAFVLSLVTIFLVIPGMPSRNIFLESLILFAIATSLVSILVSYGASLIVVTPSPDLRFLLGVGTTAAVVSAIILGLLFFCIFLLNLETWKTLRRRRREDSTPESLFQFLTRTPPERNFVASCIFIYLFQRWDRRRRRH